MNTDITLGIVIFSSVTLFIISILYIIINRGDDQILELSFKSLLIPVLIVFGLLFLNYLKPIKEHKHQIIYSVCDNPMVTSTLVYNPKNIGPLFFGSQNIMVFYHKNKNGIDLDERSDRMELVESFILHLMHKRYDIHWLIDISNEGQYFDGNAFSIGPKNSKKDKIYIEKDFIHSSFPETHLIQTINEEIEFSFPKGMSIHSTGNENARTMVFKNNHIEITFKITEFAQAILNEHYGKTSMMLKRRLGPAYPQFEGTKLFAQKIEISILPKRLRRNSPETLLQLNWADEMIKYLKESMDWNIVLEKVSNENNSDLFDLLEKSLNKR